MSREVGRNGASRRFVLVFEIDDDPMEELRAFAREHELAGADFHALGAFREATLYYWDWDRKEYEEIPVREQVEVAAMTGNVAHAPEGDGYKVHAHVVLGRRDGGSMAGHLKSARVRPTLELVLVEHAAPLRRAKDPATGLDLIRW